ncbi:hypothetical protein StoSoilB13_07260 [Arthrobacter sp. StoSoilB13]|nr:hypothetical protein StoSoilB13_07260 [Arthrobacter sp. StoSoilB13]
MGHGLLLVAVLIAGIGQQEPVLVTTGLIILGLGWSAATIAGSTLLAESVAEEQRVTVQGVSDTLMGAAGATGGATSGLVLAWLGYEGLNIAAGVLAAVMLALTAATAARVRRSLPA